MRGGKLWFLDQLHNVISEMMSEGDVVEEFYDDCSFPLDYDHDGNIWKLRSNDDHLTRSKVLYHPSVVAKKNEDIRLSVEAKTSKELKVYQDAKALMEVNKDIKVKLLNTIQEQLTTVGLDTVPSLSLCTIEMFDKLKVTELTAFYRVRVQDDLNTKFICPIKGTMDKVTAGVLDKKTKVHC